MRVDYLRVSVTDRCNLRCIYCNPLGDCGLIQRDEILTFEEIRRIVRLFAQCGISKVRLTGGEPLVRKNIVQLVQQLVAVDGIEELALTTNGVLLEPVAVGLKDAGLSRVNISIDSVRRENYQRITGFDFLENVTKSIRKAIEVGLMPVKINTVVLRGINERDVVELAQLSVEMPIAVRFIEYYPTSESADLGSFFVPNSYVRRSIESKFGPLAATVMAKANGPAVYFRIRGAAGTVGFISGRTTVFCHLCNRLRLTSDGKVRPCLYSAHHYDLKKLIRAGAADEVILPLLEKIITEKHRYTRLNSSAGRFSMRNVGG
jgi:cyclic pyranopterin phosphate synthase